MGQKWRLIACKLPGRSDDAVRNRWKRLSSDAAEADGLAPPALSPKRRGERVAWSKIEDATIVGAVEEHGLKWGLISAKLPGRTAHAIRNRFHRLQTMMGDSQRKQQLSMAPAPVVAMPSIVAC